MTRFVRRWLHDLLHPHCGPRSPGTRVTGRHQVTCRHGFTWRVFQYPAPTGHGYEGYWWQPWD